MIQFKQKEIIYSNLIHNYFYTEDKDYDEYELINYLTRYFLTFNIAFNNDLLYKAAYLTRLNGGFEYIAIKFDYGFELIYVGKLTLKNE
mgnify:CR=1 FL=1